MKPFSKKILYGIKKSQRSCNLERNMKAQKSLIQFSHILPPVTTACEAGSQSSKHMLFFFFESHYFG